MKHWWKILTLCLVFGMTTSVLIACGGPSVGASNNTNFAEEQSSAEINDDDTEQSSSNDLRDEIDKDVPADENTNLQDNPQTDDNHEDEPIGDSNENNTTTNTTDDENSIENKTDANDTPETNGEDSPKATDDTTSHDETNPHEETVHQHTCDNIWHVTKAPTCIEDGSEILICSDCGETIEERSIPATGHTHICTTTPANCETDGTETYTCHCGDSYTITIPSLGHDYDAVTHQCTRCDKIDPDYHATPISSLDPLQNPLHSYWYYQDGNKTIAFYFETFNDGTGNYCSYKGTVENGIFTPNSSTTSTYKGTYTIIADTTVSSGYIVHFIVDDGETLNIIYDFTLTYKITTNNDQVIYTLEGTFIKESLKTLTFAGYSSGDEL